MLHGSVAGRGRQGKMKGVAGEGVEADLEGERVSRGEGDVLVFVW